MSEVVRFLNNNQILIYTIAALVALVGLSNIIYYHYKKRSTSNDCNVNTIVEENADISDINEIKNNTEIEKSGKDDSLKLDVDHKFVAFSNTKKNSSKLEETLLDPQTGNKVCILALDKGEYSFKIKDKSNRLVCKSYKYSSKEECINGAKKLSNSENLETIRKKSK